MFVTKLWGAGLAALWLGFVLACTPQQPLPNPSNPPSTVRVCTLASGCSSGEVCNLAVGGGTCVKSCTQDSQCATDSPTYVCQPGGLCTPPCGTVLDGTSECSVLGSGLTCGADDAHCETAPTITNAFVRFFNAAPADLVASVLVDNVLLVSAIPDGAVEPDGSTASYYPIAAGAHTLTFNFAGSAPFNAAVTFNASEHYVSVADGLGDVQTVAEDLAYYPPGQAAVNFIPICSLLGSPVNVSFDAGTGAVPLLGAVNNLDARASVEVTASAGTLLVSSSPAALPVPLAAAVTLTAGQMFTSIVWCGREFLLPEIAILAPSGGMAARATFAESVVRLLNASGEATAFLSFDAQTAALTGTLADTTLGPVSGYALLPAGGHTLSVWGQVVNKAVTDSLAAGLALPTSGTIASVLLIGQQSSNTPAAVVLQESGLDPANATVRFFNQTLTASGGAPDAALGPATLLLGNGNGAPVAASIAFDADSGDFPLAAQVAQFTLTFPSPTDMASPADVLSDPVNLLAGYRYTIVATGTSTTPTLWAIGPSGTEDLINPL